MKNAPRHEQDPIRSNTIQYPGGFPWFSVGTGGPRLARRKAMLNLLDEELDKVKRSPGGRCGTISGSVGVLVIWKNSLSIKDIKVPLMI